GTLIPKSIEKSETAFTAAYKRASSPGLLAGHIQFAERETLFKPSFNGAQPIFVSDSVIAFRDPTAGSIKAVNGECPIEVATPSFPWYSSAITPQLFNGSCNGPAVCCFATRPVTQRSTLFVSQS